MTRPSDPLLPPPVTPRARALATLRRRAEHLYPLRDLPIAIPGSHRPYSVALPANANAPLDQFSMQISGSDADASNDAGTPSLNPPMAVAGAAATRARDAIAAGTHMPYWALLWPSGLALAEALLAQPEVVRGSRALELGSGLGVTAAAALEAGARLKTADCFPEALLFCRYNALRNTGRTPDTLLLDWRTLAGRALCLASAPYDLLLAADVLYEGEDIEPLLDLAPQLLAPKGQFWLAEPGRRASHEFVTLARARGWQDKETAYMHAWPPDGNTVRVALHRFTLPDA